MASYETHLRISNQTPWKITKITVTEIDNYDWDGGSRPDHNFQGASIDAWATREEREEVNRWARSAWFRMTFDFDNGDQVSLRDDQYEARSSHDRTLGLDGPAAGRYVAHQVSGDGRNVITLSDARPADEWMKGLDDATSIADVSIPGTHDSAAAAGVPFLQCQALSILDQLKLGIRFLDIRCKEFAGILWLFHGDVPVGGTFNDVIGACQTFLKDHPSETILLSMKDESGASSVNFQSAFNAAVNASRGSWYLGTRIPRVGDVRGKLVLLRRFVHDEQPGIDLSHWPDNQAFKSTNAAGVTYDVEDHYDTDGDGKWPRVRDHLRQAREGPSGVLYLTFASAVSFPLWPPQRVADVVNRQLLMDAVTMGKGRLGIVPLDFPGGIVHRIYMTNPLG